MSSSVQNNSCSALYLLNKIQIRFTLLGGYLRSQQRLGKGAEGGEHRMRAALGVESLECRVAAGRTLGQEDILIKEIMVLLLISVVQQTFIERQALGSLHSSICLFIWHFKNAWHTI